MEYQRCGNHLPLAEKLDITDTKHIALKDRDLLLEKVTMNWVKQEQSTCHKLEIIQIMLSF